MIPPVTKRHSAWLASIAAGIFVSAAHAEHVTNRFSLSPRFGLNISAKFSGATSRSVPATARTTPEGDSYNYDDGYVLTDISGNFGGQTWYWGYDKSASQVAGNTILFSRSTAVHGRSQSIDDDPHFGAELTYNRLLIVKGKAAFGLEGSVNFLNMSFDASQTFAADVTRVTDAYPFSPGTTPPSASPSNPYQGSFTGPGYVIGDTPVSSSTTVAPGVLMTDRQRYDANLWGFRLGPYAELPIGNRWHVGLSSGLAFGLLDSDVSWTQTSGTITTRGGGDAFDVLWGFYAGTSVSWKISEHWNLQGGAQFQALADADHTYGGRKVELELGKSIFFNFGVSYSF